MKTGEIRDKEWDLIQTLPVYLIFHNQASPKGGQLSVAHR